MAALEAPAGAENSLGRRRAAFVGLGAMGLPIACRLARAFARFIVVDPLTERVAAACAAQAGISDDPDGAAGAEIVFLCLPTTDTARTVIGELLAGEKPPPLFFDLGAHAPDAVSELASACGARGSTYCDAPVFGSPKMAERGDLYFLVSGPETDARRFADLVKSVGYRARYAGPSGAASTIKVLQNALGTANLAAAAEVLRICEAADVSPGTFIDVVRECSGIGLSAVFDRFAEDMAARRDSGEGRLRIAAKDSAAAAAVGAQLGVETPVLKEVAALYRRRSEEGRGDRQFTDLVD